MNSITFFSLLFQTKLLNNEADNIKNAYRIKIFEVSKKKFVSLSSVIKLKKTRTYYFFFLVKTFLHNTTSQKKKEDHKSNKRKNYLNIGVSFDYKYSTS